MKIKTNMFFWRLNNDFANILQKVRSFAPLFFQWVFIRGWYFAEESLKIVIFSVQIGGLAFIRAWAFIRDFTVSHFTLNNLNLLPPKPKLSVRHLKQGIQQFHEKFVLAPADKANEAGNNAIVV